MKHPRDYEGQRVVVLGLARSGVAAAKLFHQAGAIVTASDRKEKDECPEAAELEALGIEVICGGHPDTMLDKQVQLLVKNPGIPYSAAVIRQAEQLGIEIVTEVEVAYQICPAPIIGITGSNGKTTTTTLIGLMLESAGLHPIVAGNIGRPLCEAALEADRHHRMVVELSSFQLKGTTAFRPAISCMLNIYETHLDYHGDMDDYIASKAKLFANQTEDDTAIINWDDPVCRKLLAGIRSKVFPFSTKTSLSYGVYLDSETDRLVFRDEHQETVPILPVAELGIRGAHNVENALAASAAAIVSRVPIDVIAGVLRTFRGVEHRLEFVCELNGVSYYNDSKATNPAATIKSIEAFDSKIILIAGGLDRGSDYMELLPIFRDRIKGVVAFGQTSDKILHVAQLAGLSAAINVDNGDNAETAIRQATAAARSLAEPGDIVMLSPACASWDMFPSYEERGRMFKETVHNLY